MSKIVQLKAASRARAGKGASRAVRREGLIPGVVYGDKKDPQLISLTYGDVLPHVETGRFLGAEIGGHCVLVLLAVARVHHGLEEAATTEASGVLHETLLADGMTRPVRAVLRDYSEHLARKSTMHDRQVLIVQAVVALILVLDQLTFGEKVDSPDATKLPVLLAVSVGGAVVVAAASLALGYGLGKVFTEAPAKRDRLLPLIGIFPKRVKLQPRLKP